MEPWQFAQRQSLPLDAKIIHSEQVIRAWWDHFDGQVCVAFSGGKDSQVLLHLVRSIYPGTKAVFADTGLEFPEVKQVVANTPNVTIVRPDKTFKQVIEEYGYPVVSKSTARNIRDCQNPTSRNEATRRLRLTGIKRDGTKGSSDATIPKKWKYLVDAPFKISDRCCDFLKKAPLKKIQKELGLYPFVGTLAAESSTRKNTYLKHGCNMFEAKQPVSLPLAIWTDQDIIQYIIRHDIKVASVYGEIVKDNKGGFKFSDLQRTGCVFCAFGAHLEKAPNRFQQLKVSHPKLHKYCMEDLDMKKVLQYLKIPYD